MCFSLDDLLVILCMLDFRSAKVESGLGPVHLWIVSLFILFGWWFYKVMPRYLSLVFDVLSICVKKERYDFDMSLF